MTAQPKTHASCTDRRCQCRACGEFFSTVANFDRHRQGAHDRDRHCVDPASVGLVIYRADKGQSWWQAPGKDA